MWVKIWQVLGGAGVALILAGAGMAEARPWCSGTRLNETERAICADAGLRALDAQLQEVHDIAEARGQAQGADEWLRGARDRCGPNRACIRRAYHRRIAELEARIDPAPQELERPWCRGARLNQTERTVCASGMLTDLDAILQELFDRAEPLRLTTGQSGWLRGQRNACGGDHLCIAQAYLARIGVLSARLGE